MFNYLKKEIWHLHLEKLPKWKAHWIRFLRIVLLTSQGFTRSQIQLGASALTYYTLLAIVPMIAFLIGIARGFLFEQTLESWLLRQFAEQDEIIKRIFKFANLSLERVQGGLLAVVGILLLLWAVIKILMNIEYVMNQIWEVQRGRTLTKKFTDYLAMIFLMPIILFLASGLTGYLSATLSALSKGGHFLERISPFLIPLLSIIPFVLLSFIFTFLYIFMPNIRVRFLPALMAGIFTGIVYQLLQWVYLYFQIGVANYNAIYGTFAAMPLFLIWLHLSWVITLLGAKVSFAIQNVNGYEFISEDMRLNHKFRMILALRITHLCIKNFCAESPPPSIIEISNTLAIPLALTTHLTFQLSSSGVLNEVKREKDQEECFQPARSVDHLTIKRVIDMINEWGEEIPLPPSEETTLILKCLDKFASEIEQSDGNILLKDI